MEEALGISEIEEEDWDMAHVSFVPFHQKIVHIGFIECPILHTPCGSIYQKFGKFLFI